MEKEGLKRSLEFLTNFLEVTQIVTDRHVQIHKFLLAVYPNIQHKFDIWHFVKGTVYGLSGTSTQRCMHALHTHTREKQLLVLGQHLVMSL